MAAIAAIVLLASTQSANGSTHTNRLAVRLTDLIASNMEAGVARRVTTETAARGVTDPYQLGFDRARKSTLTSYQPQAAPGAQLMDSPPATTIPACMLTSSTGSNSCQAMTMPAACSTSTQCFTVLQGCTSGSAIQCGTVVTNCNITSVVLNCPNYTNTSDCANRTFFPACNNTSVNTPGYPVCYATGVGGNCNPTLTPGCQMWTMGSACDTSAGAAYCQALSVAQSTGGCTAVATGNCDVTFTSNPQCSDLTWSFKCMNTLAGGSQCTNVGGCSHTYAPGCMTSTTGGICARTSANNNACYTSVGSAGGANTCTSVSSPNCKVISAMPNGASPLAAFTLFAFMLPLGGFSLLKRRRA